MAMDVDFPESRDLPAPKKVMQVSPEQFDSVVYAANSMQIAFRKNTSARIYGNEIWRQSQGNVVCN